MDCLRLDEAEVVDVGHQGCHAVVSEPSRVDRVRDERVAEGVHLDQWGQLAGITEVVPVLAAAERRACCRLHASDHWVHPASELLAEERK